MVFLKKFKIRSFFVVMAFFHIFPVLGDTPSPVWEIDVITFRVSKYIKAYEDERKINVDPRAADHIANEIFTFISNFGFDYDTVGSPRKLPKVFVLIEDSKNMSRVIYEYLDDTIEEKNIRSLIDRLADLIDKSSESSGWRSDKSNPFKFVDLRDQLPNGEFVLISGGKKSEPTNHKRFLVMPGDHQISNLVNAWRFTIQNVIIDKQSRTTEAGPTGIRARGYRK